MDEFKPPNMPNLPKMPQIPQHLQDIISKVDISKILKTQSPLTQFNIEQPTMPKFPSRYGEGEDCVYLDFCSKLDIAVEQICTANGEYQRERCSFGDTRIIKILSTLGTQV